MPAIPNAANSHLYNVDWLRAYAVGTGMPHPLNNLDATQKMRVPRCFQNCNGSVTGHGQEAKCKPWIRRGSMVMPYFSVQFARTINIFNQPPAVLDPVSHNWQEPQYHNA